MSERMRKSSMALNVLVALAMMLSFVVVPVGADVEPMDVTEPTVSVDPTTTGEAAEYVIGFRTSTNLKSTGSIGILFPDDTDFSSFTEDDVTVEANGGAVGVDGVDVDDTGTDITVTINITGTAIADGSDVVVTAADIVNPAEGTYTLWAWTSAEPNPVESEEYEITAPVPEGPVDVFAADETYLSSHDTISEGLGVVPADGWVKVAAGTYTETLTVDTTGVTLMSYDGAPSTVIKGPNNVAIEDWPLVVPNIEILADDVKVEGFTIQGPDWEEEYYSSGMVIGASNVEICDNVFQVTNAATIDEVSQGIQTHHKVAMSGVDISGLNIHDNAFTHRGTGTAGYEAIYINRDEGTGSITIKDNQFSGDLLRAITTERSDTDIVGNSVVTDLEPGLPGGYVGILVRDYPEAESTPEPQDSVAVLGNTVKGSAAGKGFESGIVLGTGEQSLTKVSVITNTVQMNETGILVRSSADGVVVNYNDIVGNVAATTGVSNTSGCDLDARYNWWGAVGGPGGEGMGNGDTISENVNYDPWLTKDKDTVIGDGVAWFGSLLELDAAGWNTASMPVDLNPDGDSLGDIVAMGTFVRDEAMNEFVEAAWWYDAAAGYWKQPVADTTLVPGLGLYVKTTQPISIPVLYNGAFASAPSRSLEAGWNLVGSMFGVEKTAYSIDNGGTMSVENALASVSDEAANIISPSLAGQEDSWSDVYEAAGKEMYVGEAYWVYMKDAANLAGLEVTPFGVLPEPWTW